MRQSLLVSHNKISVIFSSNLLHNRCGTRSGKFSYENGTGVFRRPGRPLLQDISSLLFCLLKIVKKMLRMFRIQWKDQGKRMEVLAEITDGSGTYPGIGENQKIEWFIVINTGADPCLIQIEGCTNIWKNWFPNTKRIIT